MSITTTIYNPGSSWHGWKLSSTLNGWDPLYSVANEQLSRRSIVVWEASIIKNARLDDNGTRE
jgi:hypothetical protein